MHTALYRANALLTYAGSVLAVLCVLATITGANQRWSELCLQAHF